jgi:replicative DNA helicase
LNDYERIPPHDMNAEMAVLGGMLMARSAVDEVTGILTGTSFYAPKHEQIFNAITGLANRAEPADAVTVAAELDRRGELAKIGGKPYLHDLMQSVPSAANAGWYAQIVHGLRRRRRLIEVGLRLIQMGYETEGDDVDEIIDQAQALAMTLDHDQDDDEDLAIGSAYAEVLDSLENDVEIGLPTGLADLDTLTRGLQPGQLVVVAGRPAMGKSLIAENFVRHVAIKCCRPAGMFSLEMSRFEIARRALSAEAKVSLRHLAYGQVTDADWDRIAEHGKDVMAAPMYVDETPDQTIASIRAKARRMRTKHGIELLAVDYLQLMGGDDKGRGENRQQQVAAISRGLKLLAKELMIPVIAVAQLNRGPEDRPDKRPALSDLRDSGAIEQDADIVILIHREAAYEAEHPRAGEADLIVAKHRGGPTATVTVAFQGHYARFQDFER